MIAELKKIQIQLQDGLKMKIYLMVFALIIVSLSLKMKLSLGYEQKRCFFQLLATNQKYAIEVEPITNNTYVVDIMHQQNKEWKHSVTRKTQKAFESVSLNKLASKEALYSFCIINSLRQNFTARITYRSGLQLLDLNVLAEQSDQEMLERQTTWINKQTDKIVELVNNSKNQLARKEELQNMMSSKFIVWAIIGILSIIALNTYFYFSVRKTFRQRKMI